MKCPNCESKTIVLDSRCVELAVARHRHCSSCGYSFYTEELEAENAEALRYYYRMRQRERREKS